MSDIEKLNSEYTQIAWRETPGVVRVLIDALTAGDQMYVSAKRASYERKNWAEICSEAVRAIHEAAYRYDQPSEWLHMPLAEVATALSRVIDKAQCFEPTDDLDGKRVRPEISADHEAHLRELLAKIESLAKANG